jgi:DNA-binding response OmpR family regulator
MVERFMRILVAEDFKELADTYKMALEERGHVVITTRDGIECIQTYKEFVKHGSSGKAADKAYFDTVILDHFMPGMDGVDVAKEIQEINPKQRIIFITGGGNEVLRKLRGIKENVEFMNKPFTLQALITQIESWPLHMWRMRAKQGFKEWDGYEGTSVAVGPSRA